LNGYLSITKDEALEMLGLCNQQQNKITKGIIKKVIQYCWERSWFEIAFKYHGLIED